MRTTVLCVAGFFCLVVAFYMANSYLVAVNAVERAKPPADIVRVFNPHAEWESAIERDYQERLGQARTEWLNVHGIRGLGMIVLTVMGAIVAIAIINMRSPAPEPVVAKIQQTRPTAPRPVTPAPRPTPVAQENAQDAPPVQSAAGAIVLDVDPHASRRRSSSRTRRRYG